MASGSGGMLHDAFDIQGWFDWKELLSFLPSAVGILFLLLLDAVSLPMDKLSPQLKSSCRLLTCFGC